ncbi:hypothetical protein B0J18DRAFT_435101 [Chaetomium sp. MPI-SDFR-AT-0129]|nr:hypothetical protein B0J18DRAFT_435101 [Chaetomium sp. MPI-SDFR-AT-0129]
MAAPQVYVFQTLGQTQEPTATGLDELKNLNGFRRALFGPKLEDPNVGVLLTEWLSPEAALAYQSSQPSTSLNINRESKETVAITAAPGQDWESALRAPCTEVFTAYGPENGYVEGTGRFVSAVDTSPAEGYKGAAFGSGVVQRRKEGDVDEEQVVRLVLGWTSREAHLEAKGKPGAIQENIHELRSGRRAVDLFHVQFREL